MNTSAWFFRILIIILILISCTISLYTLLHMVVTT